MLRYPPRLFACCSLVLAVFLTGCSAEFDPWHQDSTTGRWFSESQLALGQQVYATHCASCHGPKAEATPQWTKTDAQGLYPPPPLNGTAHAWHHSFQALKQMIEEGSRGRMPAWKGKLTDQEIEAVIAWFQSLWPDEGYEIWQRQHKK